MDIIVIRAAAVAKDCAASAHWYPLVCLTTCCRQWGAIGVTAALISYLVGVGQWECDVGAGTSQTERYGFCRCVSETVKIGFDVR